MNESELLCDLAAYKYVDINNGKGDPNNRSKATRESEQVHISRVSLLQPARRGTSYTAAEPV